MRIASALQTPLCCLLCLLLSSHRPGFLQQELAGER